MAYKTPRTCADCGIFIGYRPEKCKRCEKCQKIRHNRTIYLNKKASKELKKQLDSISLIVIRQSERWEKLKIVTTDIYHKLDHHDVWGGSGDTVCDKCEDFFHKKMQELESGEAKKEMKG